MSSVKWTNGLFSLSDGKDCGAVACCQLCIGGPCIFGSAIERAGIQSCLLSMGCVTFCFPCYLPYIRSKVAERYGIDEGILFSACAGVLCPCCSCIQVLNENLVQLNTTYGWCGVRLDGGAPSTMIGGAPNSARIER